LGSAGGDEAYLQAFDGIAVGSGISKVRRQTHRHEGDCVRCVLHHRIVQAGARTDIQRKELCLGGARSHLFAAFISNLAASSMTLVTTQVTA